MGLIYRRGVSYWRYIIRASFSQERMTYLPDKSTVLYGSGRHWHVGDRFVSESL